MRTSVVAFLAMTAMVSSAHAKDGRGTTVTIYSGGVALVEDTRDLAFTAGRSTIQFPDVSARIRPETAILSAEGVAVVEQNFDFDLLTPQKLMEKALGRTVTIVRTNPGTGAQTQETATVLSTQGGVVLKVGDRIEVLRDDGVPTRVIFDKVPENLRAQPTLSMLVASNRAGNRPATLSYMTEGLRWKADYVLGFDDRSKTIDLQGWVTLLNDTGIAYQDAQVKIGANTQFTSRAMRSEDGGDASGKAALFQLPEAVTIADRQAKQIGMLELRGVRAEKVYRMAWRGGAGSDYFSGTGKMAKAQMVLRFEAKDGSGQTSRLPRGALRGFLRDAKGDAQFIGETEIGDIATGGKVEIAIAQAFDIDVQAKLVADERVGTEGRRRTVEYTVTNASDTAVPVEIEEGGLGQNARVVDESVASVALDAYRRQWAVTVPAKGKAIVTAVLEQGR